MKSPTPTLLVSALLAAAGGGVVVTAQTTFTTICTADAETVTATATATSDTSCASGIHLIVARGSTEDVGLGLMEVVATNITAEIPGSSIEAVDYPATIEDPVYYDSVLAGNIAMEALLTGYVALCPDAKVALLGFSQGGQIAEDLVCGTTHALFTETADLSTEYQSNIVAVVMFGNPTHLGNASWNAGTSTNDGIFPREDVEGCDPYTSKMRSWCDTGDIYCDTGNDTDVHGSYFETYTDEAAEWVVSMYEAVATETETETEAESTETATTVDDSAGFRITPTWSTGLALGVAALLLL